MYLSIYLHAVYNVSWICRERTAKTVNCCNYSYQVQLSLFKSCLYSVFAITFCGEMKLCNEVTRIQGSVSILYASLYSPQNSSSEVIQHCHAIQSSARDKRIIGMPLINLHSNNTLFCGLSHAGI